MSLVDEHVEKEIEAFLQSPRSRGRKYMFFRAVDILGKQVWVLEESEITLERAVLLYHSNGRERRMVVEEVPATIRSSIDYRPPQDESLSE